MVEDEGSNGVTTRHLARVFRRNKRVPEKDPKRVARCSRHEPGGQQTVMELTGGFYL
jgi:hypothetical protein